MIQSVIMLLPYLGSSHSAENVPHFLGGLERSHKGLLVVLLFLETLIFLVLLKGVAS